MFSRINIIMIFVLCGAAFLGFAAGHVVTKSLVSSVKPTSSQIRQNSGYAFINPLLECEMAEGSLDARNKNFDRDLEEFVEDLKREKNLTDIGVYYRDLNNGPTFGANEESEFLPASLLKVPVMMAYYRLSEQHPELLGQQVAFEKPVELGYTPTINPREHLVAGQSYTVDELIRQMIIYSDNQALLLLSSRLPREPMQELFAMLGVGEDVLNDPEGKLNVKEYAAFFRILFNSSYLSRENSEKALALLAMTDYKNALPAGVPDAVKVAHKFGEAGTTDVERQLHDCGIIYFDSHPYLACVMTRGHDPEILSQAIKDVSGFIHKKVDEQY